MKNATYRKTMENLTNKIIIKLVNNEKDYLKCTSKPSYISHRISDNNMVVIHKSKLALKLNKSAYIGMCILELGKVLMNELCYDYINNKYANNTTLFFTVRQNSIPQSCILL